MIVCPETNIKYNLNSIQAGEILKKYILAYNKGGASDLPPPWTPANYTGDPYEYAGNTPEVLARRRERLLHEENAALERYDLFRQEQARDATMEDYRSWWQERNVAREAAKKDRIMSEYRSWWQEHEKEKRINTQRTNDNEYKQWLRERRSLPRTSKRRKRCNIM